jgi:hypothetical protein
VHAARDHRRRQSSTCREIFDRKVGKTVFFCAPRTFSTLDPVCGGIPRWVCIRIAFGETSVHPPTVPGHGWPATGNRGPETGFSDFQKSQRKSENSAFGFSRPVLPVTGKPIIYLRGCPPAHASPGLVINSATQ